MLADGLSNKQVAVRLGLSERTVGTYLERLYERNRIHTRAEAIALWASQRRRSEPAYRRIGVGATKLPRRLPTRWPPALPQSWWSWAMTVIAVLGMSVVILAYSMSPTYLRVVARYPLGSAAQVLLLLCVVSAAVEAVQLAFRVWRGHRL